VQEVAAVVVPWT
jgi:hypothetical protein